MASGRIRHPIAPTRWPTEAEASVSKLFSPISVGPIELEQRTWVPAMVPWRATSTGEVSEALLAWYGRFARGRPGALVVEATGIRDVPSGPLLRIGHDRYIEGLSRLVETVHRESEGHTRLLIQLIDFLAVKRRPEPHKYFHRFLKVDFEHRKRLAEYLTDQAWLESSDADIRSRLSEANDELIAAVLTERELEELQFGYRERVTDLHLPHIRSLPSVLPELFAQAALRAEQAGFDGVELHFAHAYTMASFLSRRNHRDDGYGGSLEHRVRLPLEVYTATKAVLSKKTALGCRFLGDEVIEGGSRINDATYFAQCFAKAGMDYLSVSKGGKFEDAKRPRIGHAVYPYTGKSGHECMPTVWSDAVGPFGRNLGLSRAVREAVHAIGHRTPVVGAGGINTFELAEAALIQADADIIASARQSLADPDWFAKVRAGQGHQIRRCAFTNYCEGLDQQHKMVTCRLWDRDFSDGPPHLRTPDGKRRLVAPKWLR